MPAASPAPVMTADFKIDRTSFLNVPIKNKIPAQVNMTGQNMGRPARNPALPRHVGRK
ncbi:MAG: hypothetical protein ACLQMO_03215 [Acidobacteriaceae bacterium]